MNNKTKSYMGIELGSTRIKSVLIDEKGTVLATGAHTWENRLENGLWTYSEGDIHEGFRASVKALSDNAGGISNIDGIGISGMMHGYIALDKNGELLVPFITWRNTNACRAADILTKEFGVNIPMRWSIAQLYEAILNDEEHVKNIAHITTLSGYVHYKLTGKFILGICDGSGMFPIDTQIKDYDQRLLEKFDALIAERGYPWKIKDILPKVLTAGENAGTLTEDGVKYIGYDLPVGLKLAPPEGDGGTGMVATGCVKTESANISAGTSIFAMVVMDKPLKSLHTEIDPITTPHGKPVSMVHCNNCTSDINAWAEVFRDFAVKLGVDLTLPEVLDTMFRSSDGAVLSLSLINYNYISGEPIVGLENGVPLFMRSPDASFDFALFSKSLIYSSLAGIAIGLDILSSEGVEVSEIFAHGGFVKTPDVGQRAISAAVGAPVSVMRTAGEGGAWGMAILTALADSGLSLEEFTDRIFKVQEVETILASTEEHSAFIAYLNEYKKCLPAEAEAAKIYK